jgi:hypothetical protein
MLILLIEKIIFLIQIIADLFQNRNGIGIFHRMLAQTDKRTKQSINVCKVEISGSNQGTGKPVVLSDEWMTRIYTVPAKGAVTQMPKIKFPTEAHVMFKPFYVTFAERIFN